MASLSQGHTAAAQCGLFTHKSVPVIFEPPCTYSFSTVATLMHHNFTLYIHCLSCTKFLGGILLSDMNKIYIIKYELYSLINNTYVIWCIFLSLMMHTQWNMFTFIYTCIFLIDIHTCKCSENWLHFIPLSHTKY